MLDVVLQFVAITVASAIAAAVRLRLARRRRARVRRGSVLSVPARYSGGREGRLRRGRLVIFRGSVAWYGRRAPGPLVLDGASVLGSGPPSDRSGRQGDVEVRLALPEGGVARLRCFGGDAATLDTVLTDALGPVHAAARPQLPLRPPPRPRWWTSASFLLALGWLALYAGMAFSATAVPATVVHVPSSGTCDVRYLDSTGRVRTGEVDCVGNRPGQAVTVWRFDDDPGDVDHPIWFSLTMVGIAVAAALPGAAGVAWVRRRRRAWEAATPRDLVEQHAA